MREDIMQRLIVAASVLLLGYAFAHATDPPQTKRASVNGVNLTYQEQGQGKPVVFVHGAGADYRVWEGEREAVAPHYRFVALTQRYFGTDPWADDGSKFSMTTHADDLAAFIGELNAGPVDIVGWSYSGPIGLLVAMQHPELVHGLFLYEPGLISHVTDPDDLQIATDDRKAVSAPAAAASKAGDTTEAIRLLINGVSNQQPGYFETATPSIRSLLLDNARTLPLFYAAPPPPQITCEQLGQIKIPVTIARGDSTRPFYKIAADTANHCIPGSKLVVIPNGRHVTPMQDPSAFNEVVLGFLNGGQ
jgi:pimeloyl-ACP methyl ester carboxylesterase